MLLHLLYFKFLFLITEVVEEIDVSILNKHDEVITKTFLYGNDKFNLSCNKSIISSTIESRGCYKIEKKCRTDNRYFWIK